MKKALEIIDRNLMLDQPNPEQAKMETARQIHEHYRLFAEWLKSDNWHWFNPVLKKWGTYDKYVKFEEIYEWYCDNILNKTK